MRHLRAALAACLLVLAGAGPASAQIPNDDLQFIDRRFEQYLEERFGRGKIPPYAEWSRIAIGCSSNWGQAGDPRCFMFLIAVTTRSFIRSNAPDPFLLSQKIGYFGEQTARWRFYDQFRELGDTAWRMYREHRRSGTCEMADEWGAPGSYRKLMGVRNDLAAGYPRLCKVPNCAEHVRYYLDAMLSFAPKCRDFPPRDR